VIGVIMAVPVALVVKVTLALLMTNRPTKHWRANNHAILAGASLAPRTKIMSESRRNFLLT
jgi:post-segregation antitoxin (ccd killing protein)